jgi:DnaJ-class molecular chaperone
VENDCFAILGLTRGVATSDDVRREGRKLFSLWHPDKVDGNSAEFDKVKQAYDQCLELIDIPPQPVTCNVCNGTGRVGKGHGWTQVTWMCNNCLGSGKL